MLVAHECPSEGQSWESWEAGILGGEEARQASARAPTLGLRRPAMGCSHAVSQAPLEVEVVVVGGVSNQIYVCLTKPIASLRSPQSLERAGRCTA